MRKLTQKLVLSVVTMALVVIALGTSTFAWFTLTNSATIQSFDAQVTSGEGIEISLGDFTLVGSGVTQTYTTTVSASSQWYTVLSSSVINARLSAMYATNGIKLVDVTSGEGEVVKSRDGLTTHTSLSGKYVQFDIFFRSSAVKTINWNSVTLGGDSASWTVDVPTFRPANDNAASALVTSGTILTSSTTAARVSIDPVIGSSLASTPVYELPELLDADPVGVLTNSRALPVDSYGATPFGAASYWVAKGNTAIVPGVLTLPTTITSVSTPVTLLTLVNSGAEITGFPTGYYYGKVTVRVWLEGWDADAYDAIFSRDLTVALGFNA